MRGNERQEFFGRPVGARPLAAKPRHDGGSETESGPRKRAAPPKIGPKLGTEWPIFTNFRANPVRERANPNRTTVGFDQVFFERFVHFAHREVIVRMAVRLALRPQLALVWRGRTGGGVRPRLKDPGTGPWTSP